MGHVQANRLGMAFAAVLAAWHAAWALLVAFGAAQPVLDFVYRLHFMKSDAVIGPFDAATAAVLVASTAAVGYVSGVTMAMVWNCMHAWLGAGGEGRRRPACRGHRRLSGRPESPAGVRRAGMGMRAAAWPCRVFAGEREPQVIRGAVVCNRKDRN